MARSLVLVAAGCQGIEGLELYAAHWAEEPEWRGNCAILVGGAVIFAVKAISGAGASVLHAGFIKLGASMEREMVTKLKLLY